ncbi:MAG: UDP-N-acetylglucosamine 1-carboxyvinyltransferase, partial [Clostridiales bacterium]|nr:UDP-N-acetylglucosamine 1-carboxyvinyltransferase [Clostridiales bacterium]
MTETLISVEGGCRLSGKIAASGSKNAVLPIIAAALLSSGACKIMDVPKLADVDVICQVLEGLGAVLSWRDKELHIKTTGLSSYEAPEELVSKMRASFLVMGPLLARMGKAKVSLPGGCAIGARPVALHIKG